jgi:serine/threonine protein kinase
LRRTEYTAPEVKAGGAFTPASDVFALGLLLFRLLTGLQPFGPRRSEAVPARKLCPACPPGLEVLLVRMLNPDPRYRPTLAAVQEMLGHAQAELEGAEEVNDASAAKTPLAEAQSEPAAQEAASTGIASGHTVVMEPVSGARKGIVGGVQ